MLSSYNKTAPRIRPVPAVSRAAAILRLLSRGEGPLGVQAVARALGLVPSTALHILRALAAEQLLAFDPQTKRYALAGGVVALARGMLRHDSFAQAAQPLLDALARAHGVTTIGVEAVGLEQMVVVALARPAQPIRLQVELGSRYPAMISATGRCIGAFGGHPRAELDRRFASLRWDNPPSLDAWHAEVAATRAQGFAVDEGAYIEGVTILAAPVFRAGRLSHTLVLVGTAERLRRLGTATLGAALRADAQRLCEPA
jgi:DNA-binding IclR family transcriptional regulator